MDDTKKSNKLSHLFIGPSDPVLRSQLYTFLKLVT